MTAGGFASRSGKGVTGDVEGRTVALGNAVLMGEVNVATGHIDAAGEALIYSSYVGGSGDDDGGAVACNASIAVDSSQNAYLSGCTFSTDFPRGRLEIAAPHSIPAACNGGCGTGADADAFVMKISK